MSPPLPEGTARLYRSRRGRLAGGICRGLALHLGVNVWLVRATFAIFTWLGGLGVFAYAGFWIFVPLADVPGQERSARARRCGWHCWRCAGSDCWWCSDCR